MSDRELLEAAAKAVGYELGSWYGDMYQVNDPIPEERIDGFMWNPLTNDGDAFRLAVRLNMVIKIDFDRPQNRVVVGADNGDGDGGVCKIELGDKNPYAATRRAIVRAAAEIGKEKP